MKTFEVYSKKPLFAEFCEQDLDNIILVENESKIWYYLTFFNIITFLRRGFFAIAMTILFVDILLLFCDLNGALMLFSIFIGLFANDLQIFWLKFRKFKMVQVVCAKSEKDGLFKFVETL